MFLSIRYFHKNKKEAYQKFLKRYNAVTRKLIQYNLIPNEEAMVKSKIHQKYHPKAKKWEFSQIFALFYSKEDVDEVMDVLQEYNL